MSKSDRLPFIRSRAVALGLARVAMLPGLFAVSRAETEDSFEHLAVNSTHSAPSFESTADDSSELSMPETLAARHLSPSRIVRDSGYEVEGVDGLLS
jgi:hypothetical protein